LKQIFIPVIFVVFVNQYYTWILGPMAGRRVCSRWTRASCRGLRLLVEWRHLLDQFDARQASHGRPTTTTRLHL
jgi:hypothetical protein